MQTKDDGKVGHDTPTNTYRQNVDREIKRKSTVNISLHLIKDVVSLS